MGRARSGLDLCFLRLITLDRRYGTAEYKERPGTGVRCEGPEDRLDVLVVVHVGEGVSQAGQHVSGMVESDGAHVAEADVEAGPCAAGVVDQAGLELDTDAVEVAGQQLQVSPGSAAQIQQSAGVRAVPMDERPTAARAGAVGLHSVVQGGVSVEEVGGCQVSGFGDVQAAHARLRSPTSRASVSHSRSGTVGVRSAWSRARLRASAST